MRGYPARGRRTPVHGVSCAGYLVAMKPAGVSIATLALCLLASGCAPNRPDQDAWRALAQQALGDASSAISTDQVTLEKRGKVFPPYLKTVVIQAEDTSGKSAQKFASLQPPGPYRQRYETVTSALDDAGSLLSDVRIAVVRHDTAEYPQLLKRLKKQSDKLSKLQDHIRALADDGSKG